VKVAPEALPDLLLSRYCAGGWQAIQTFGAEVFARATGLVPPSGISGGAPATASDRPTLACQSLILTNLAQGTQSLDELVVAALVQVAHDLVDQGTNRISQLQTRLKNDLARYGLAPKDTSTTTDTGGGTEGGPGGAEGGPEDQIDVVNPTDPAATPDLCRAVRQLYAARQHLISVGSEPTEGASAFQMRPQEDVEAEKSAVKQAADDYAKLMGQIVGENDRNHPIAPAVFELVTRQGQFGESGPDDAAIERVAYQYLRDTSDLAERALPKAYPYAALSARATPVEGPVLQSPQPKPGEQAVYPETRAAYWAMEGGRDYAYEPLNDEALMLKQLWSYLKDISEAPNEAAALTSALRFQALRGMIESRDEVEQAQRAARESGGGVLAAAGTAAAFLDLLGIFFPPAEVVGQILGNIVLAGTAIYLVEDLPSDVKLANSQLEQQAASALIASEYATTALALAARPTVASVVKEMAKDFATVVLLSKMSRLSAMAVRIWLDFQQLEGA
jgi:hypothetical protein